MENQSYQGHQAHILIVDQNQDALALLKTVLSRRGYQVTTAQDGLEGLEKFRHGQFQLILTDLSTARLSGWELGRIVKETSPGVRVALVTAWDFGTMPEHSPFDAIIPKPFHFDEFRGVVDSLMRDKSGGYCTPEVM
ncbi:MAG: response regulator [Deltaproteobacteria bacterium]|nr:response regulator [Deltaproteobacteria bacterium]MBW2071791.1 response regulator [Deltaproteobacteria bacterium]